MIEDRIKTFINVPYDKDMDIGEWLGFPFEGDYKRKETTYLNFEVEVLNEIILFLQNADPSEKFVIDTTGSAPYAGDAVMKHLKELTCIIHLSISQHHSAIMLQNYLQHPRPVLWGDKYIKKSHETENEALSHSYEELLIFREKLYKKYAHNSIPYDVHRIEYDYWK